MEDEKIIPEKEKEQEQEPEVEIEFPKPVGRRGAVVRRSASRSPAPSVHDEDDEYSEDKDQMMESF